MPNVEVQKVNGNEKATFPILQELAMKFDGVRSRAFDLFEKRGSELGHELEDWLKAEREILGAPDAELADRGNAYEVKMALPGFDPKDVQITATSGEIIVHATSRKESKSEVDKILWSEFSSRDVYRHIPAPTPLNVDATTASLEKGMLRITAPKAAEAKAKAVSMKAA
jgi:HSP20 family protein